MDLRAFTKEWRPERWLVQEAFIAFRQRNNSFVKSWQDKGIWVKCSKWWMITRKIRVSLTKFVGVDFFPPNVFLLPGTERVPFIREIYILLLGEKDKWRGGQSDLLASAVFSDSFSSRHLMCQGAIAHSEYQLDATIAAWNSMGENIDMLRTLESYVK